MALIKLPDEIRSIRGPFGGMSFTSDASGQHLNVKPRTTKRQASNAQSLQRKWYSSKKHAERFPYPPEPPPDDEIPPGTHCVYSCKVIWAHRQPSLTQPTYEQCNYFDEWPQNLWLWVQDEYKPKYLEWGLTKQLMWYLSVKYWYVLRYTKGMNPVAAFHAAKVMTLKWISASAGAVAVPALGLWVGIVALGFYFAILEWLEGQSGQVTFNPGRIVIRKDKTLWWGGLIGRPSHKMYDFAICQLSPFEGLTHEETWSRQPYRLNWFYFNELWQTSSYYLLWWYVYNWQTLKTRFRGKGYLIGKDLIRMEVSESQHKYWNVPIGWTRAPPGACYYLLQFDEHFSYRYHPKPPL